ncbi:SH3 domain-containing protein Dlish [Geodia barretti]|uniref:SH3 domain-containing protein Dlish n=1 Tax=Geodia barretti TaxID=519541 RepID=A0AA35SA87_GEOBA|nr:SH3 domain-containing protein Dlish [Geodia barretti]
MAKVFFHLSLLNNFKGSKPVSLSQGTSPITQGPPSLGSEKGSESPNNDVTITLPHSNTQSMIKKLIVVQKYEPKPGEKGLAVSRGETVLLVRDDGDWMYVRNESGTEGFVPRSHLLSPSRTRTRTSSRSGTTLRHVASNGCVEVNSTTKPETGSSALSQDEGHHHIANGHHHPHHLPPSKLSANEILYDRKMYSPSPSSGVASLADQFSPGLSHSPIQDRGRDRDGRGRRRRRKGAGSVLQQQFGQLSGGGENAEGIPRSNSSSSRSTGDSVSAQQTPLHNGIHYVDKNTNHIYSTLEQPASPPPPPLPPRNAAGPGFSASQQEPEPNAYSQLERAAPGISGSTGRTCSQEALVHPSHHHNSFSEGWTRDRKALGYPSRSASAKARVYKEVVEIRQNSGSSRGGRQRIVPPPPLRVSSVAAGARCDQQQVLRHQRRQQNWNHNETQITKFRKTVWGVFVVTHDFDPLDENEIAIRKGEHVSVWNQDDRDWFWVVKHASSGQEEGFVPSGCLREVSADSKVSVRSGSACHTPTAATPVGGNSPRLDDITLDPIRHRTHSQESRHSNPTHQSHPSQPRPSPGVTSRPGSTRERRSSESGPQVHRVHTREPPLSLTDEPLPPGPPSSPPPPYTEFDTNRRFVSLSQQPAEVHHHSQPVGGYLPGMHRTRSQGYVTSRSRAVHYPPPNSPSSPRGVGGGTLV